MVEAAGLAVRVQGMRRYYALLLTKNNKARLVKALDSYRTGVCRNTYYKYIRSAESPYRPNANSEQALLSQRIFSEGRGFLIGDRPCDLVWLQQHLRTRFAGDSLPEGASPQSSIRS
jgi:hypothetical protein